MLKQISVFADNRPGMANAIMKTLKANKINACAMTISESNEYGIVRLVVDNTSKAADVLRENDFTIKIADVTCVSLPDELGALSNAMQILEDNDINIRYAYLMSGKDSSNANIIIRTENPDKAEEILTKAGVKLISHD